MGGKERGPFLAFWLHRNNPTDSQRGRGSLNWGRRGAQRKEVGRRCQGRGGVLVREGVSEGEHRTPGGIPHGAGMGWDGGGGSWDKVRGELVSSESQGQAVPRLPLTGSTKIFHISRKAIHSLFSVKSPDF